MKKIIFIWALFIMVSCQKEAREYPQPIENPPTVDNTFSSILNTSNSGLLSNVINDIDASTSIIRIATDLGYTTFDGIAWNTLTTSNSNLPSDKINCVLQQNSITWIGTDNGLVRFNGVSMTIYKNSNSPLPINKIRSLEVDNSGKLWIGTFSGGGVC
ncbi:MAG TPA: two-component regulator propeller domain-containing protein, partial [Vicingus sp.]|nr:two-component regulator propeller domain-containing protein [Vicingus sp.]